MELGGWHGALVERQAEAIQTFQSLDHPGPLWLVGSRPMWLGWTPEVLLCLGEGTGGLQAASTMWCLKSSG